MLGGLGDAGAVCSVFRWGAVLRSERRSALRGPRARPRAPANSASACQMGAHCRGRGLQTKRKQTNTQKQNTYKKSVKMKNDESV